MRWTYLTAMSSVSAHSVKPAWVSFALYEVLINTQRGELTGHLPRLDHRLRSTQHLVFRAVVEQNAYRLCRLAEQPIQRVLADAELVHYALPRVLVVVEEFIERVMSVPAANGTP